MSMSTVLSQSLTMSVPKTFLKINHPNHYHMNWFTMRIVNLDHFVAIFSKLYHFQWFEGVIIGWVGIGCLFI